MTRISRLAADRSTDFPICLIGYLTLPTFLPWLVSFRFVRRRGLRLCFLFFLFAAALVWYFLLGFDSLLSKAYRRGL